MDKLEVLKDKVILAIKQAPNEGVLVDLQKKYLGRKGELTLFFKSLKNLSESERKNSGQKANEVKIYLQKEIDSRRSDLRKNDKAAEKKISGKEWLDVTAPGKKFEKGHSHILSRVIKETCDVFESMGFEIVFGPDVETEYYNFDALNIPSDHPARDMWDTFWLRDNLLLRTHTSPMQIRYMETHKPPLRIIVPGRCYRYEAIDSTHDMQFYQLEGLMIGENITLAHLKGILGVFFQRLFNKKEAEVRFRPSYFPFVEPGVEVDLRFGKNDKWLEIAGAGMVHPQVLKNVKIDPLKWQGFAFGLGIDRVAMLKYKIDDIRLFYSADLRFIKQF